MQGKKRYLALILFLLIGLATFSFANPSDQLEPVGDAVKKVNESTETEEKTEAEKAVEEAELRPSTETVEEATTVIQNTVTNNTERVTLTERVEEAKKAIDASELVATVEKMVESAKNNDDITASENYFIENNVEQLTGNMDPGAVKDNLEDRVNYLNTIFDDSEAPVITGISNGEITKNNVKIVITDDTKVTTKVTLNNNEIDFAEEFSDEGVYTINAVDEALHPSTITFTIDKTAPKFEGLPSREAHIEKYVVDVTDTTPTTITLQKDHGSFVEIQEGYEIVEEGTYQLVGVDSAANKYTTWIIIDKTYPTISGVTNGSTVNKCENVYVFDRYLTKVVINDVTYTRSDFTHDVKNENFNFSPKKICSEGTYTIIATDKSGKSRTETFTIDRTPASRESGDLYVDGLTPFKETIEEKEYNVYYTKAENTINANVAMNEELKSIPTFTFYNNGNAYTATSTSKSYDEENNKWYYHATLVIPAEMTNGEITYIVSNIIDKAGNTTNDIEGPSNSNRVFLDKKDPVRLSTDYYVHGITQIGKVFYTQSGRKLTLNIKTDEQLAKAPTFTLHSNGQDIVLTDVLDRGQDSNGKWLYQASFIIENLADGEITFTISNIADKAGNTLDNITDTTNGRRIILDNNAPASISRNIYTNGNVDGNTYYATNGNSITAYIRVSEQLKTSPTITFHVNGKDYVAKEVVESFHNDSDKANGIYKYKTIFEITEETEIENGEVSFTVSNIVDKAGNTLESLSNATNQNKVIIDRKYITLKQTSLSTDVADGKTYYAKNGDTISFNIGLDEMPLHAPTVTIGGKNVTLTYDKYYSAIKTYLYKGSVTIPENETELVEGQLKIEISNVVDKAGNVGFYYSKSSPKITEKAIKNETTNGKKIIYDRTPNRVTQTFFRGDNNVGTTYYVKNGSKIQFNIGFNELLSEDAVVTIGGKKVELTYEKYYKATNSHMYYGYLNIDENETLLTEGIQNIVITNITDFVGNKGFYYQTNGKKVYETLTQDKTTNQKQVYYDTTGPAVTASYEEKTIEEDSVTEFTEFPSFNMSDNSNQEIKFELVSGEVKPNELGTYELLYKFNDVAGNVTEKTIKVHVVDTKEPKILNVEQDKHYKSVTPEIEEKHLDKAYIKVTYLDGKVSAVMPYTSGTELNVYGTYELTAIDESGNSSSINFVVDNIAPKVLLLDKLEVIRGDLIPIKPVIIEENIDTIVVKKDGTVIEYNQGDQLTADGDYEITVTDKAGNTTTSKFSMDNIAPILVEPINGGVYKDVEVKLLEEHKNEDAIVLLKKTRTETVGKLEIPIYEKIEYKYGDKIEEEGEYIVVVADQALNVSGAKFTVDRTPPTSNLVEGKVYNEVTPEVYEANVLVSAIFKDGRLAPTDYKSGDTIKEPGNYKLYVIDKAGNDPLEVNFKVDGYIFPTITPEEEVLQGTSEVIEVLSSTTPLNVKAKAEDKNISEENSVITPTVTKYVNNVEVEKIETNEIDIATPGTTYTLEYKAVDEAGNETTKTIKVAVVNISYEIRFDANTSYTSVYNGQEVEIPQTAKMYKIKQLSETEKEETEVNNEITYSVDKTMKDAGTYTITAKSGIYEKEQTYTITQKEIVVNLDGLSGTKAKLNDTLDTYKTLITSTEHYEDETDIFEYKMYRTSSSLAELIPVETNKVDKITETTKHWLTQKETTVKRYYTVYVSLKEEYAKNYKIKDAVKIDLSDYGINFKIDGVSTILES